MDEPEQNASEQSWSTPSTNDVFSEDLMITSSERFQNVGIRPFFKLFPDTNFNTEILDVSGKFRTYDNPSILSLTA